MALELFDAFGSVEKTLNATWVDALASPNMRVMKRSGSSRGI